MIDYEINIILINYFLKMVSERSNKPERRKDENLVGHNIFANNRKCVLNFYRVYYWNYS